MKNQKYICPECGRSNIRYRFKTQEYVCNLCGWAYKGPTPGIKPLKSKARALPVEPSSFPEPEIPKEETSQ